jgi:hypothetical protein
MSAATEPRFKPLEQAVYAGLSGGDGVIVDTASAWYFGLNRTAAFLWDSLVKMRSATRSQLAEALCVRFEVARPEADRDVGAFLDQAVQHGLCQVEEAGLNVPPTEGDKTGGAR